MRVLLAAMILGTLTGAARLDAADTELPKGVKKVEAAFDPPEAKPGQTVTLKITVTLADGYHSYPTKQSDKNAEAMVNSLTFGPPAGVIFVGEVKDPAPSEIKAEPELGIKELKVLHGTFTYERKAVVSPKASAGELTAKVKALKLTVCDATNCFPPKTVTPEAKLKVSGSAVPVEAAYKDEVEKALADK